MRSTRGPATAASITAWTGSRVPTRRTTRHFCTKKRHWQYRGMLRFFRLAPLLAAASAFLCQGQDYKTWADYGGSPDSAQYSALTQIDRSNVTRLKVAWKFP